MKIIHLIADVFESKNIAFTPKKTVLRNNDDAFIVLPQQHFIVNILEYDFIQNKKGEMQSYLSNEVKPATTFFDTGYGQFIGAEESAVTPKSFKPVYSEFSDEEMALNSFTKMLMFRFPSFGFLASYVIQHNNELRAINSVELGDLISVQVNCAGHRDRIALKELFSGELVNALRVLLDTDISKLAELAKTV